VLTCASDTDTVLLFGFGVVVGAAGVAPWGSESAADAREHQHERQGRYRGQYEPSAAAKQSLKNSRLHPSCTVIETGIEKVAPWQPFEDAVLIEAAPGRCTRVVEEAAIVVFRAVCPVKLTPVVVQLG
jgi:hypothetical protein